jgi:class 3 adenylate cyclase
MLAVMDSEPRRAGPGKMARSLGGLAQQVLTELDLRRALNEMNVQRRNVDELLCNVLPGSVAVRLLKEPRIVDEVPSCTCCFLDLIGFTAFTEANSAQAVVQNLDALFTVFDMAVLKHGVCKVRRAIVLLLQLVTLRFKIKTIGDGYFFAGGVPEARADHIVASIFTALACVALVADHNRVNGTRFALRCGLATGPAVAGVVGTVRFAYDLWGSTVNLASRTEAHGAPNVVTLAPSAAKALRESPEAERFMITPQEMAELKGIGPTQLYAVSYAD